MANVANTLNTAVGALISRLDSPGLVQQNITVQVDTQRKVEVTGMEELNSAIRSTLEERFGRFATSEEQAAIRDTLVGLVARLNEAQIVNSRGF